MLLHTQRRGNKQCYQWQGCQDSFFSPNLCNAGGVSVMDRTISIITDWTKKQTVKEWMTFIQKSESIFCFRFSRKLLRKIRKMWFRLPRIHILCGFKGNWAVTRRVKQRYAANCPVSEHSGCYFISVWIQTNFDSVQLSQRVLSVSLTLRSSACLNKAFQNMPLYWILDECTLRCLLFIAY